MAIALAVSGPSASCFLRQARTSLSSLQGEGTLSWSSYRLLSADLELQAFRPGSVKRGGRGTDIRRPASCRDLPVLLKKLSWAPAQAGSGSASPVGGSCF